MWNCNANLITVWYSYCLKGTWYLQTAVVHSINLSWPEPRRQRRIYTMAQMKAITMDSFYRISYPEGIFMIITLTEDLQFGDLKINLCERKINNHATKQPFCWQVTHTYMQQNYFWSNPFRTILLWWRIKKIYQNSLESSAITFGIKEISYLHDLSTEYS